MDERRERLITVGAETLADGLLKLAMHDDAADDLIDRLIAAPEENIKRFKSKISGLKRMRRFVPYGEASAFAHELEDLLDRLRIGVNNPRTGAELVAAFYKTDEAVFNSCDDSSGTIGNVYRYDARELFVSYASRCEDKEWLADLVLKLNEEDHYGVRDSLIDHAAEYLPETVVRTMIDRLWAFAEKRNNEYEKRHYLLNVESLARQIKDAPLFEKTRLTAWGEPSTAACVDIGRVYLESGDAQTALSWLERIPLTDSFQEYERDKLLLEIYGKLGKHEKRAETSWRIFASHRSKGTLDELLGIIGEDQRNRVVRDEARNILDSERLSYSDAGFLIEAGCIDEAETYLFSRADQLDGDFYTGVLPLAESMERHGRLVTTSLLYRSLLDSILRRGVSKYYHHGIRYLKKLDEMAGNVDDWEDVLPHAAYKEGLRQSHGRKWSFWSRYEEE